MSARPAPNPHVSVLAGKVVEGIDRVLRDELAGALLEPADEVAILLAAAHGRAKRAGLSRDELERLARVVWDATDEHRRRESRSLDVSIEDIDRKVFKS